MGQINFKMGINNPDIGLIQSESLPNMKLINLISKFIGPNFKGRELESKINPVIPLAYNKG